MHKGSGNIVQGAGFGEGRVEQAEQGNRSGNGDGAEQPEQHQSPQRIHRPVGEKPFDAKLPVDKPQKQYRQNHHRPGDGQIGQNGGDPVGQMIRPEFGEGVVADVFGKMTEIPFQHIGKIHKDLLFGYGIRFSGVRNPVSHGSFRLASISACRASTSSADSFFPAENAARNRGREPP